MVCIFFLYFSYIHFRFEIDEYMAPKQFLRGLRPYKSYIFSSNVKQKKKKIREGKDIIIAIVLHSQSVTTVILLV